MTQSSLDMTSNHYITTAFMKTLICRLETIIFGNVWSICSHFLIKASEFVPVLYQTIQQIELNNVTAVIQVMDEFNNPGWISLAHSNSTGGHCRSR
jgi:hypothetical protein